MSDAKLQSVRVSRVERRTGRGFRPAVFRAANDNRPQNPRARMGATLGRHLISAIAFSGVAALLVWSGWTALLLWRGLAGVAG